MYVRIYFYYRIAKIRNKYMNYRETVFNSGQGVLLNDSKQTICPILSFAGNPIRQREVGFEEIKLGTESCFFGANNLHI